MYYSKEVISYLQHNHILALKFDRALAGVGKAVSNQINSIGLGAKRALYYTSCFTDEFQDVCQRQKIEDIRFRDGVIHLLQRSGIILDMLVIYFEEVFKDKTSDELDFIKNKLMAANIHIAASYVTNHGFALATATYVALGTNLALNVSSLTGKAAGAIVSLAGLYGIVQKAADSAHGLRCTYPSYYTALYAQELEMMFFLIESLMERSGALKAHTASSDGLAEIITRMIR